MTDSTRVFMGVIVSLLIAFMLLSADSSLYGNFAGLMKLAGIALIVFSGRVGRWLAAL